MFFFYLKLSSNTLDYELLDKMNQTVAKNIELMKRTSEDVVVTNEDLNQKFRKFYTITYLYCYKLTY